MTKVATFAPRPGRLIGESIRAAIASRLATTSVALVVAIVGVVIMGTTGRAAAAEATVMNRIDSIGTRLITVVDSDGSAGLSASSIPTVNSLPGVEWAVGLGPAEDVYNAALPISGTGTPHRSFHGSLESLGGEIDGRTPRTGEAVAVGNARTALGLRDGTGAVSTDGVSAIPRQFDVVGTLDAAHGLEMLDGSVLIINAPDATAQVRFIYVMARSVADVETLMRDLSPALTASDVTRVRIQSSSGLLALRDVVSGDLARSSRQTMLFVLIVGIALVCVTMSSSVAARKRDFGRRRALGASRSAIVVMVSIHTLIASVAGAAVGVGAGLLVTFQLAEALPPARFALGVATLTVLAALVAAIPASLGAALRDPVRILRVP